MSHNIVTECPACTTRFQVTQGQLKIANGKVRCGSCLEIFNAEVYRCDDLISPLEELAQKDKDLFQKDPLFDQIEVPAFAPPQRSTSGFDKRYSTSQDEPLIEQLNDDPFDDDSDELEQPIQELIEAEVASHQPPVSEQTKVELISDHPVTHAAEKPPLFSAKEAELEKYQSPISEAATEVVSKVLPAEPRMEKQERITPTPEKSFTEATDINPPFPLSESASITPPPLTRFQPEPVMIRATHEEPSPQTGWTVLVLLSLLMLAAQYLWFNRQQLSAYPELTSGYKLVCELIPCELQAPINLQLINTQKLIIQQQAEYQGALSVNLLLKNRADFNQPFPAIQLAFSNRRGELISQRVFQPAEYLKSTHTEPMNMPAGKSVQISFDILDPGSRALSYEALLKVPSTTH